MLEPRENLSPTEWSLMKICWEKGETTARGIYDESLKTKQRGYQTVKTMLDRLAKKGYLDRKRFGPLWLYKPAKSRSRVVAGAIERFVDTVLDNTLAPLVVHFAKRERISTEELAALKELIEKNKEMNKE